MDHYHGNQLGSFVVLGSDLPWTIDSLLVNKSQGQEAPIVLVSMTTSDAEDSPHGADFILNANRLNVAIRRAQILALVFSSPSLLAPRLGKLDHLNQVNHLLSLAAPLKVTKIHPRQA